MPVEIPKLALVVFGATVTEAGTVRAPVALLVNPTAEPPDGAGFDNVKVQVTLLFEPNAPGAH
jgi:hypothetical protein